MTCNFRIGQKVVLVSGEPRVGGVYDIAVWPSKGVIYTIRAINDHGNDKILLRFEEIDNRHLVGLYSLIEPGFNYRHFRPVVGRGTEKGMSILREILNKADKPAEVSA